MKGHVIFESRTATLGLSMPFLEAIASNIYHPWKHENINLDLIPDRLLAQTAKCQRVDHQEPPRLMPTQPPMGHRCHLAVVSYCRCHLDDRCHLVNFSFRSLHHTGRGRQWSLRNEVCWSRHVETVLTSRRASPTGTVLWM